MPASQTDPLPSPAVGARRRRAVWLAALVVLAAAAIGAWLRNEASSLADAGSDATASWHPSLPGQDSGRAPTISKTDAQWRAQLTSEQFEVTRRRATERAFTGKYWDHHEQGVYKCVCCGADLFTSQTKYDSHCGWPSFSAPGEAKNLHTQQDVSRGMVRTEVICRQCGAHLGHLFDDGPQPTGMRYCINSASLAFEKKPLDPTKNKAGDSQPHRPPE